MACQWSGVAMTTASMSLRASSSRKSRYAAGRRGPRLGRVAILFAHRGNGILQPQIVNVAHRHDLCPGTVEGPLQMAAALFPHADEAEASLSLAASGFGAAETEPAVIQVAAAAAAAPARKSRRWTGAEATTWNYPPQICPWCPIRGARLRCWVAGRKLPSAAAGPCIICPFSLSAFARHARFPFPRRRAGSASA